MSETLNVVSTTDFAEETKSVMNSDYWKSESAPEENSNGYVAVDVANLLLLANGAAGELDFAAGIRTPVKKTLSRKGSQRGGEWKLSNSAVKVAAGTEKLTVLIHAANDGQEGILSPAMTTTARVAEVDGHLRRLAFRRPAPWLDPRRVLVFFATLSSVGTLILLYFTLFMGNIPGGDGDVW